MFVNRVYFSLADFVCVSLCVYIFSSRVDSQVVCFPPGSAPCVPEHRDDGATAALSLSLVHTVVRLFARQPL